MKLLILVLVIILVGTGILYVTKQRRAQLSGQKPGFPVEEYNRFDDYAPDGQSLEFAGKKHCLLLCTEVLRSEMEYAMEHGSQAGMNRLREGGHYPYSNLDRGRVY